MALPFHVEVLKRRAREADDLESTSLYDIRYEKAISYLISLWG